MGNTLDKKPDNYSVDRFGKPIVYKGDYMQTYTQNNPSADSLAYGQTRLQFGAKIVQDIDSGPRQGDYYVTSADGTRHYVTQGGKMLPDAANSVRLAKNYGNGPAVMISGSPLQPTYNMFYSEGGEAHGSSNEWTTRQVNSPADIISTMTTSQDGHNGTKGKFANYYGDASINPFSKEGRNFETDMYTFQSGLVKGMAAVAVPVIGTALDDVVPFGSTLLNITGANKAIQQGVDSLAGLGRKSNTQPSAWDPNMSNIIRDPRLKGYLNTITDQTHQLIAKYGPSGYEHDQQMAADTPQQMISKAKALAAENKVLFAQSKVQEMQDLSAKLQRMLPPGSNSALFSDIKDGLALAQTPEQQMNVIEHFSGLIKSQVLPSLASHPQSADSQTADGGQGAADLNPTTASAQIGHPVLSINGTDSRHPAAIIGQETMSSAPPTAHG